MASTHERRRAASRRRLRRQRWAAAVGALGVIVLAVAIASSGHGSSHSRAASTPGGRSGTVVPGGPLAPAKFGGLGALWAPQNVVGSQPTTAAAYQAASKLPGLPGYLLIADR